jgi:hypothetical protein
VRIRDGRQRDVPIEKINGIAIFLGRWQGLICYNSTIDGQNSQRGANNIGRTRLMWVVPFIK